MTIFRIATPSIAENTLGGFSMGESVSIPAVYPHQDECYRFPRRCWCSRES
jgi:hypothetical protein